MTEKQLNQRLLEIEARALGIFGTFQQPSPRSYVLRNSIKVKQNAKGFELVSERSAFPKDYYMPYTNEPWISPRWRGRENPNLYWFENAHEQLALYMARHLGGTYVRIK
jgi:hypothetical protein